MLQPSTHTNRPSHYNDRWDPYRERDEMSSVDFDDSFNRGLMGPGPEEEFHNPDLLLNCLDAPDRLPLGGTRNIFTLGGWHREDYLKTFRDCDSWEDMERAEYETSQMLKEIMTTWD